jgi:hypothetical protein
MGEERCQAQVSGKENLLKISSDQKFCKILSEISQLERNRFLVISANSGEAYLVDLEDLDSNGQCNCRDFETRRLPELQKEIEAGVPITINRCKHITGLLKYLGGKHE